MASNGITVKPVVSHKISLNTILANECSQLLNECHGLQDALKENKSQNQKQIFLLVKKLVFIYKYTSSIRYWSFSLFCKRWTKCGIKKIEQENLKCSFVGLGASFILVKKWKWSVRNFLRYCNFSFSLENHRARP